MSEEQKNEGKSKEIKEVKHIEKLEKEIHKPTEKALVCYYHLDMKDYGKGEVTLIEVKDETSEKAFETLKKIKELEK